MSGIDVEHLSLVTGAKPVREFDGIFLTTAGTRPVMSVPPTVEASKAFVDQVRHELDLPTELAERVADWAAARMDRFSAVEARPVFEMDGSGPCCSTCGCIWPLCGHYHWSYRDLSEEAGQ